MTITPLEIIQPDAESTTSTTTTATATNRALNAVMNAFSNYEKIDEDNIMNPAQVPSDALSNLGWGVAPAHDRMEKMITLHGKHGIITGNRKRDTSTTSPEGDFERRHPSVSDSPYHAMLESMESLELGEFCAPTGTYVARPRTTRRR